LLDQSVRCLALNATTLYAGGDFTTVNGVARSRLAAFDRATGSLTAFDPNLQFTAAQYPLPWANSIALSGGTLYAAGWFDHVGGQAREYLAAVDATTGALLPWDAEVNRTGAAVAVANGTVLAGGSFSSAGGVQRTNLAALDLATGKPTSWAPVTNNQVDDMVTDGTAIWIGGYFNQVNARSRPYVARLDPTTGVVDSWNPNAPNVVTCLALAPSRLYIGGYFPSVMAVDPGTAAIFAFSPNTTGGPVNKIVPDPAADAVNVASQGGFWRFDANNSSQLWTATIDGAAYTVTQLGGVVYLGGSFFHANGTPRQSLAAFNAATGALLPWAPEPNNFVGGLEQDGQHVYAAGAFTAIGGQPRIGVAVLEPATGMPTSYDAQLDDDDYRVLPAGADLILSGNFASANAFATPGFAVLPAAPPLGVGGGPRPAGGLRLVAAPVPARTESRLSWTLPVPARVSLDVMDVQGRVAASLLRGEPEPAGEGSFTLRTAGWRPGVYLVTLRTSGKSVTRRIVVTD